MQSEYCVNTVWILYPHCIIVYLYAFTANANGLMPYPCLEQILA